MKRKALKAAFPYTIPIMIGFLFMGFSFGILMKGEGLPVLYSVFMSILIFSGSMQFVAVGVMTAAFDPVHAFLLTLMVNARYLFYGIPMLEKYGGTGLKKPYLIFGMCDETFTINCSVTPPEDVDKDWFMFFVTILNHIYWITGSTLGAVAGSFLKFNTTGIDFIMTALFTVMLVNQWEEQKDHAPALIGIFGAILCLFVFGADSFMIPAMLLILVLLSLLDFSREKKLKAAAITEGKDGEKNE